MIDGRNRTGETLINRYRQCVRLVVGGLIGAAAMAVASCSPSTPDAAPLAPRSASLTTPDWWPTSGSSLATQSPPDVFRELEDKSESYFEHLAQHLQDDQVVMLDRVTGKVAEEGDSATYTSYLLAAQAMRYRATGDQRALASVQTLTAALGRMQTATGTPGLIGRFVKLNGDPWLTSDSFSSKDVYTSVPFGLAWAWPLLPPGPLKEQIRKNVQAIGDEFLSERADKPKYAFKGAYSGQPDPDPKHASGAQAFVRFGPRLSLPVIVAMTEQSPKALDSFAEYLQRLRELGPELAAARTLIRSATDAAAVLGTLASAFVSATLLCPSLGSPTEILDIANAAGPLIDDVVDLTLSLDGRGSYGGPAVQRQIYDFVDAMVEERPANGGHGNFIDVLDHHWNAGFVGFLNLAMKTTRDVPDDLSPFFALVREVSGSDEVFYGWLQNRLAGRPDNSFPDAVKAYALRITQRLQHCRTVKLFKRFAKIVRTNATGTSRLIRRVGINEPALLLGQVLPNSVVHSAVNAVKKVFKHFGDDDLSPAQVQALRDERARREVAVLRAFRSHEAQSFAALRDFMGLLPGTISSPEDLAVDVGDGTLLGLQVLKVSAAITGDPKFTAEYDAVNADWLAINLRFGTALDKLITQALGDDYRDAIDLKGTHALKWMALWTLLRLEADPAKHARLLDSLTNQYEYTRDELNALADFIYAANSNGAAAPIAQGIEQLLLFPRYDGAYADYCPTPHPAIPGYCAEDNPDVLQRFGGYISFLTQEDMQGTRNAIPLDARPRDHFTWQRSPRRLRNNNTFAFPGIDYQLAYWMSREYGFSSSACPSNQFRCRGVCSDSCSDLGSSDAAVFAQGADCAEDAALGCAGFDSAISLICSAGKWSTHETCDGSQRCDTRVGATQGQCLPLIAECGNLKPQDAFCRDGERRVCGPDRVTDTSDPCTARYTCAMTSGSAVCTDVLECATANGGCDPLATCAENTGGPPVCGDCPAGYVGSGQIACSPTLTALLLSAGTLVPALSAEATSYAVNVGIATQTVALTPSAPSDASITINGKPVTPGLPWQSPQLNLGDNVFTLLVRHSGQPERSYQLTITRGLEQRAYVKASNTGERDAFGQAVALSADGSTFAVGAPNEASSAKGVNSPAESDDSASLSGAVYVFTRSGTGWTQQAYVKASNTQPSDSFGFAVALSSDGNTLAVGARQESGNGIGVNSSSQPDNSTRNSGAVYVFSRSGNTWTQQAYVKASNTGANDSFGFAVALAANGNTLAVGARGEGSSGTGVNSSTQADDSALDSGAVYVFTRSNSNWSQQEYVKASNTGANDYFGDSLTLSADGNVLAVGAVGEDSSGTGVDSLAQADDTTVDSGAVYIFARSAGSWSQQAYVKASNTGANDYFGGAVALSGNGDVLAVGAVGEDSSGTGVNSSQQQDDSAEHSGAVYILTRSGDSWSQQAYVKASNSGTTDYFGRALAASADGNMLAVGAPRESSSGNGVNSSSQGDNSVLNSGAVYVFARSGTTWSQPGYVKASNTGGDDTFGDALALSGDGNVLVAGADGEDSDGTGVNSSAQLSNSATFSGAVYIFE